MLQGLPPILPAGPICALVLGSFPSIASLRSGQYYEHAGNRFWRVLAYCNVIEDPDTPHAMRITAVRRHRLPIRDIYALVRRQGSGDDRIREPSPTRWERCWPNGVRSRSCSTAAAHGNGDSTSAS